MWPCLQCKQLLNGGFRGGTVTTQTFLWCDPGCGHSTTDSLSICTLSKPSALQSSQSSCSGILLWLKSIIILSCGLPPPVLISPVFLRFVQQKQEDLKTELWSWAPYWRGVKAGESHDLLEDRRTFTSLAIDGGKRGHSEPAGDGGLCQIAHVTLLHTTPSSRPTFQHRSRY